MKKNIIIILVLVLLFTGCENKEEQKIADDKTKNNVQEVKEDENKEQKEEVKEEKINLENLEAKLNELNINITTIKMEASYVKAIEGYKYKTNNATLEVYKFDTSSEAYKKAETNQKITLESGNYRQNFNAVVKNGYAYILDNKFPEQEKVKELLNKLQ